MGAGGEELAQAAGGVRDGIRPRDADRIKTVRAGGLGERALERGRPFRRQKSRLA
jgi:hypothetical protein